MDVSEIHNHLSTERLEAYVEERLDDDRRAAVQSHVSVCTECRAELDEMQSLFSVLASLPTFAPSAGFADLVMARVRVRRPAFATANAWVQRVTPHTTRGWAAAAALLALPVIGAAVLVSWLMMQPGVSPQSLWTLAGTLSSEALSSGWQWAWARFAGTTLAAGLAQAASLAQSIGRGEIGLAAVLFAMLTAGSSYVLYQNLFRTEARRTEHATYVF